MSDHFDHPTHCRQAQRCRTRHVPPALLGLLVLALLLMIGCGSKQRDYPVTVIPPAESATGSPAASPTPRRITRTPSPSPVASPTFDWSVVTLMPEQPSEPITDTGVTEPATGSSVPDPLTEADLDLLTAGRPPFDLSDAEISLGRMVLPIDLLGLGAGDPFRVESVPISEVPGWRFLAFDLPRPGMGELGPVVRAPIGGRVMAGAMQMINGELASTVSIDHPLTEGQVVRATLVYSGTIEPFFFMRQQVEPGDALFRLTAETGRLVVLGSTPIPGGAVLTLHASIDTLTQQPSGVEALKFLRGIALTPAGFVRDQDGLILSPATD